MQLTEEAKKEMYDVLCKTWDKAEQRLNVEANVSAFMMATIMIIRDFPFAAESVVDVAAKVLVDKLLNRGASRP